MRWREKQTVRERRGQKDIDKACERTLKRAMHRDLRSQEKPFGQTGVHTKGAECVTVWVITKQITEDDDSNLV